MPIESVKCPSCGASLPVPSDGSDRLNCHYCGTGLLIEQTANKATAKLADEVREAIREAREEGRTVEPETSGVGLPPKRRVPAFALVLGIGVLFLGGLLGVMLVKPPQKSLCDEAAPDWSLGLFQEYRGGLTTDTVSLSDLRGKGVVLNFWASWCGPCEEEAATLEASWKKYKDKGIVFIGVDYLDQDPAAMRYLQKFSITYPNGPDLASKVSKRYTIRGVPETFFIDPQGKLVGCRKIGPFTTADELDQRIGEIMPK